MADDHLLRAQMDFSPVPPAKRRSPGRIKSVPARLYVSRFQEHKEAYEFLQEVQSLHGNGAKTLIRAVLYWRDTVAEPLEKIRAKQGAQVPEELHVALLEFQPIRSSKDLVKHVSVRLYIDKWIEHREAYEFLQRQQRLYGQGNKTIVRALLHYRDKIYTKLQEQK
jgi:hypothetical protein